MTSPAPRPGFADEELGELLDAKTRRALEFFSARLESARVLSVGDVS
jgi:hypothetical protein